MIMPKNLWFKGKKTFKIALSEMDLKLLVFILEDGSHGGMTDEKLKVKESIISQIKDQL
jgi:hypothetical protein